MIKKRYGNIDVVTAARQRIKNIFDTSPAVSLSLSGGKDSICLNDLIYKMCESGEIDKSKLVVNFIDEEAIFPCVERTMKNLRKRWMLLGVEFRWWCIEVKHYNCFNQLTSDESFICWDRYKQDCWVRPRPSFALVDHPLLDKRNETYQAFLDKINKGRVTMIGIRVAESIQRYQNVAKSKSYQKLFPIYDWKDTDVWKYIYDNGLEFPEAYIYMYQIGRSRREMRISQFFSIDTAKVLVQMNEFYPDLFERVCRREPNAYLAMLYFDTELFRRSKKSGQIQNAENTDYQAKVLEVLGQKDRFITKSQQTSYKNFRNLIVQFSPWLDNKNYKEIYNALIAGDPKQRTYRAIYMGLLNKVANEG